MSANLTMTDLPARIVEKIEVRDGHWYWTGWANDAGYPYVHMDGRDQPAYRVVYELLIGPIPERLELDHLCVTPMCVWPLHMEPVSHAENQRRIAARQIKCRRASHDWTDEHNVHTRPNGRRYCRACANDDQRTRRATTRSAA